jgi:hypothetical protein
MLNEHQSRIRIR